MSKSIDAPSTSQVSRTPTASSALKAYGKTMIGLHPIYLLSEAVQPNKKVGSFATKNAKDLLSQSELLRSQLSSSANDVLIIIDDKLQRKDASKSVKETGDLLNKAGSDAIVVVTRSMDLIKEKMDKSGPEIKQAFLKHGKDAVIVVDKGLRNPMVISGVTKFAKSKGIPASEAILQVASLALSRIIDAFPDDLETAAGATIEEIDATDFENKSSSRAKGTETRVGREVEAGEVIEDGTPSTAKKDSKCLVS